MAVLVVAIHVQPFTGEIAFVYNNILARIADPLFFEVTAFLFFEKIFAASEVKTRNMPWQVLGTYMKRILQLYLAWFVIYSPVVLLRTYSEVVTDGVHGGRLLGQILLALLRKFWLSGFYGALWFLTALLLAIPLTFLVTKYLGPRLCILLSAPLFLLTVLRMEYSTLTDHMAIADYADALVEGVFGWYGNGLTYGFFFCALGMWVAWKREQNKQVISYKMSIICVGIGLICLIVESYVIRIMQLGQSYGAMFFLIPVSFFLLLSLLDAPMGQCLWKTEDKRMEHMQISKHLRQVSVLIFTMHYGVMELLEFMAYRCFQMEWNRTLLYIMVLLITILMAEGILRGSQRIRWMRFLY